MPERTCTMTADPSSPPCGQKAVVTVTVGCVHEHLVEESVCEFDVEVLARGRGSCTECFDVDGHRCEVFVLAEVADA